MISIYQTTTKAVEEHYGKITDDIVNNLSKEFVYKEKYTKVNVSYEWFWNVVEPLLNDDEFNAVDIFQIFHMNIIKYQFAIQTQWKVDCIIDVM